MRNLVIVGTIVPLAIAGCGLNISWDGPSVAGSDEVVTEPRDVADFDEVSIGGAFDVVIRVGDPGSLSITADDNLLPFIETTVTNRRLSVDTDHDLRTRHPIRIEITTPTLEVLRSAGSSDVTISGVRGRSFRVRVDGSSDVYGGVDVEQLTARVSGSGDLGLSGRADRVDAEVSGSGEIDLAGLESRIATAHVSGSGEIELAVSDSLEATVSGSGEVSYRGNPRVRSRVSGSGEVSGA